MVILQVLNWFLTDCFRQVYVSGWRIPTPPFLLFHTRPYSISFRVSFSVVDFLSSKTTLFGSGGGGGGAAAVRLEILKNNKKWHRWLERPSTGTQKMTLAPFCIIEQLVVQCPTIGASSLAGVEGKCRKNLQRFAIIELVWSEFLFHQKWKMTLKQSLPLLNNFPSWLNETPSSKAGVNI